MDVLQLYARELLAKHPIWAIILASLPTALPLFVSLYLKRKELVLQGDKSDDQRSLDRGKLLDAQQAALNDEHSRWFSLLRDENTVLRQMVKDREHWLDIARAWYNRTHELVIMLRETYYQTSLLILWIKSNPSITNAPPVNMEQFDPDKLPEAPISIEDIQK